jgi:hypothetical protein
MTLLGKLLTYLNVLVGLGLLTWAVSAFLLRPGYFDPAPDPATVEKGSSPVTFDGLKKDADAYFRLANSSGGALGESFRALEQLEERREARRRAYAQRLDWARNGIRPKDPLSPGFFLEKDPGVIPKEPEPAEKGPDDKPLRGADTLEKQRAADVQALIDLSADVAKARLRYAELTKEIVRNDARLAAMTAIRDEVQAEAFYLAAVEVNVYEARETVLRRKRQLDGRLAQLRPR